MTKILAVLALVLAVSACDSAEERKAQLTESGVALLAEGAPDRAQSAFQDALRIDEAFAPAHLGMAKALLAQNKPGLAAGHLTRGLELDPAQDEARIDLAEVLLGLGEADAAMVHAEEALVRAPGTPKALAVKSGVLLQRGERTEARELARAALAAAPDLPIAWLTLIADRVQVEDFAGALGLLDEVQARPEAADDQVLQVIRISVLERMGDREGLGAALRKLAAAQPDDPGAALALVRWHMQGEPPETAAAEELLRGLAARNPDSAEDVFRLVEFINQTRGGEAARAELLARAEAQGKGRLFDRTLAAFDHQNGAPADALARLDAGIAAQGESEDADATRVLLARLLATPADAPRRAELVAAVLARDPTNVDALALRAETHIREDRYEAAIQDLHAALAGAPQSPELLELLAVAHERNGAPDLARERRAFAVQASNYAPEPTLRHALTLIGSGAADTAEGLLAQALERAPDDRRLLGALAEARLARGDADGAKQVAARLEQLGDSNGLDARIRAAALSTSGRSAEARDVMTAAWEASGGGRELAYLVQLHMRDGERDKAEALLGEALAANPDNLRATLMLAEVQASGGDAARAAATLEAGLAAAPNAGILHLAVSRLREAAGDIAGADAAIDAGLAAEPDNRDLRFTLALRHERNGDIEAAIALYDKLYEETPGNEFVANNLASLLAETRDDPESLARAAAIARRLRGSSSPMMLDTYGWTLHRIGQHAEAVTALKQSAAALDAVPLAHFHLGMAAEAAGDPALARTHLTRALALADAGAVLSEKARTAAGAALARLPAAE